MTETSAPYDGSTVNEAQWRDFARFFLSSGVILAQSLIPGVGYPLDNLYVFGDSSGRQVKVNLGPAWVDGHSYRNSAQKTVSIAANASGNPRVDAIVLRSDRANKRVTIVVLQGTPGAPPIPPVLSQSDAGIWDIPLGYVTVASSAVTITAADVTDARPIAVGIDGAGGGRVKLAEVTAASAVAALSVTKIPSSFNELEVSISALSDQAQLQLLDMTFNGITGANYSSQNLFGAGTLVLAERPLGEAAVPLSRLGSESSTGAGIWSVWTARLKNYTSPSVKQLLWQGGADESTGPIASSGYAVASIPGPVTRVDVKSNVGNLVADSKMTIYGIR